MYEKIIEAQLKNEIELYEASLQKNHCHNENNPVNNFEQLGHYKSAAIGSFIWFLNIFSGIHVLSNYST